MTSKLRIIFKLITTLVVVPIFYLNVEVLAESFGWQHFLLARYLDLTEVPAQPWVLFLTQTWVFALTSFIVGMACGVWVHWTATKKKKGTSELLQEVSELKSELATRARKASSAVNEIIAEEFKPNLNNFGKGESWEAQEQPQLERATSRYQRHLASECQEIMQLASKFMNIEHSDRFFTASVTSRHSFSHIANLLARIAADLS